MSSYLLAIDVGNTATSFGLFPLGKSLAVPKPKFPIKMTTSDLRSPKTAKAKILNYLSRCSVKKADFEVLISSVAPSVDPILRFVFHSTFGAPTQFVSACSKSKVRVLYKKPSEVGADRVVNARGALAFSKGPFIIVDFGTATTFDCVSSRDEYLGGVIAPGPALSAQALYRWTEKLPYVYLRKPVRILGQTTVDSIRAGLYYGYRGLVKEIVKQLKRVMGPRTLVLATGGQAGWVLRGLDCIDRIIPHLTLIGLYHLWKDAKFLEK